MLRLEHADGLGVLEALGQREDQDRVQPVDRLAVAAQQVGGAADGVGAGHCSASGARVAEDEIPGVERLGRRILGAAEAAGDARSSGRCRDRRS